MKLAIMQPYFLPWIGYYALIKCADHWIFNDEVQMIHKGWVERNRILKQYGGWQYIRIPLQKYHYTESIKNIHIRNNEEWQGKIVAQLAHYKKKAPYYWNVMRLLDKAFEKEYDTITEINAAMLEVTCAYLHIDFEYEILSKLDIDLTDIKDPDDWSLTISEQLNYDHYVNPIMGKQFYDAKKYEAHQIKLNFLKMKPIHYEQFNDEFIDGLSIIDVMMFNSPEKINKMLDEYELLD
jgi:hypothetical protein